VPAVVPLWPKAKSWSQMKQFKNSAGMRDTIIERCAQKVMAAPIRRQERAPDAPRRSVDDTPVRRLATPLDTGNESVSAPDLHWLLGTHSVRGVQRFQVAAELFPHSVHLIWMKNKQIILGRHRETPYRFRAGARGQMPQMSLSRRKPD
jgi:hypothetical protein